MRKRKINIKLLFTTFFALLFLIACSSSNQTIQVGVVGEDNEEWDYVIDQLAEQDISVELVRFSDYNQPNQALEQGEIDLNAFQHKLFLSQYNEDHETNLTDIADTVIAPLGLYSETVAEVDELENGATISIPNDVSNGGRALILLETAGLIEVDPEAGVTPTREDILNNPLNLTIEPLDASQTARSLGDVEAAVINSGMAVDAGLNPTEDPIFLEPVNEESEPYVNVVAAQSGDDREEFQAIIEAFQTPEVAEIIVETSGGASVPAWD